MRHRRGGGGGENQAVRMLRIYHFLLMLFTLQISQKISSAPPSKHSHWIFEPTWRQIILHKLDRLCNNFQIKFQHWTVKDTQVFTTMKSFCLRFYKISLTLEMSHRKKKNNPRVSLIVSGYWLSKKENRCSFSHKNKAQSSLLGWVCISVGSLWLGMYVRGLQGVFFFIYILILHWNTISVCTQANLFVSMPHVFMYTCGGAGRSIEDRAKSMWS